MIGKKKVFLVACKDYNFYNFRSELILELLKIGFDVTIVCPPGDKIQFFIERGCHFIGHMMDIQWYRLPVTTNTLYCK